LSILRIFESFIDVAKYIVPLYTGSSFKKEDVIELLNNTWA